MAKINLRGWRDEQAQLRKQNFATNALGAAILGGLVVFAIGFYFDTMKERQAVRNNYLKQEIAILDKDIGQIRELKDKKEQLLDRLNAIQELQGTRPLIVRNFDELVRVLPDELFYTSLSRTGDNLALKGRAASNLEVSTLMRNLNASIWFGEPELSTVGSDNEGQKNFQLGVIIAKPESKEAEQ